MTEITVTADKQIYIVNNEKNYRGEIRPDIFRIFVPREINGISSKDTRITFNYVTPSDGIGRIMLNEIGGRISRLGNYYVFELRMEKGFYESDGNVKCWIEFENNIGDIRIKSECGSVLINKHYH